MFGDRRLGAIGTGGIFRLSAAIRVVVAVVVVAVAAVAAGGDVRAQTPAPATQTSKTQLVRAAGSPPRTSIPESVAGDVNAQYFFLHDDNFFALQTNGGSPPRVKFQISVRFEMLSFWDRNNFALNFAYTQKSFWDALDFDHSSPFVESNYHPELFVSYRPRREVRYREAQLGCQHESNGLGAVGPAVDQTADSRGWNSCFAQAKWGFSRDPAREPWFFPTLGARAWYPFLFSPGLIDHIGYVQLFLDLDLSIPDHLQLGRFSTRITARQRSIQGDLFYAILPLSTHGQVRAWLFTQIFHGEAERLITASQTVTHIYAGIGFQ